MTDEQTNDPYEGHTPEPWKESFDNPHFPLEIVHIYGDGKELATIYSADKHPGDLALMTDAPKLLRERNEARAEIIRLQAIIDACAYQ